MHQKGKVLLIDMGMEKNPIKNKYQKKVKVYKASKVKK